ncbi:NAD(P)H-dependent oxidoreductase [Candidatus Saccharibacteria bacterium]|nr:NAD(P)H-dependent oxidoreductase [Candidatus Saccharibacteria bacterium]
MDEKNKAAVVYFSRTNNTERLAKIIAEKTGADLYKIEAKTPYTDDDINWHDKNCRANLEQNDDSARPEITTIPDISEYDTIYLGYPIWWYTLPKIMDTFIETNALNGKKIIAFCTSGSSDIETSVSALKNYGLDVIESQRFGESASENEVENWLKGL